MSGIRNDDDIVKNDITLQIGKPDTKVLQRNNLSLPLGRDEELYEAQISGGHSGRTFQTASLNATNVPGPHTTNSQALRG